MKPIFVRPSSGRIALFWAMTIDEKRDTPQVYEGKSICILEVAGEASAGP